MVTRMTVDFGALLRNANPVTSPLAGYILGILLGALAVIQAMDATATPPGEPPSREDARIILRGTLREAPDAPINYLRELVQMCQFLAGLQVRDFLSPENGGVREEEVGGLHDAIETDNTLEAIWCWSRYQELTGLDTFAPYVNRAWQYCENFPAWEEGFPEVQPYYAAHNCAWGLVAARQYEAATGDTSRAGYAAQCAAFIATHSLDLEDPSDYYRAVNLPVKGWCAGNLYAHAQHVGDPDLLFEARAQGQDVFEKLNEDPAGYLATEIWAMSGGTALWGVCESVFQEDPVAGAAWIEAHGDLLETWVEYSGSNPEYNWDTSWNVAYANAHFAMAEISGDAEHHQIGCGIIHALLALDEDDDGGIMTNLSFAMDRDASWVTAYTLKFGVDRLLGVPRQRDTGVVGFPDLFAGQIVEAGQPYPLRVTVTNYGLQTQTGVPVILEIGTEVLETTVDLDMAGQGVAELDPAYVFSEGGPALLRVRTGLPGDEDPSNDGAEISINVSGVSGAVGSVVDWRVIPLPNPASGPTLFRFKGMVSGPVELTIFDLRGCRIARLRGSTPNDLLWNGRDAGGHQVPAGTYFYRARSGSGHLVGKVFQVH